MNTDQNLLFGVLALQLEFIDAQQFAEACGVWATRKETGLGDVLLERGWIDAEAKRQVEELLDRKLRKHRGDARTALGTVADANLRNVLHNLKDRDVDETLSLLAPAPGYIRVSDEIIAVGEERSHYTLSRMHDQGGLGRVWIAHDRKLHREVALKEIRPDATVNAQSRQRFVREAQIASQLQHPNIVPVYELGHDVKTRLPFYTMRFMSGQELAKAIDEYHRLRSLGQAGHLELCRLLNAFVSVCHAVGYAHSRGVIHRDLKPSNVMIGGFGEVVVLDWGLAKALGEPEKKGGEAEQDQPEKSSLSLSAAGRSELTRDGQAVGTPAYMAPEQARGEREAIDTRTDIYGLGAILFRILTGQRPHRGRKTKEILAKITEGPTPEARLADPSVPPALNAICLTAMDKQPSGRYQSAAELAEDVQRWLADEPVSVYPDPWPERAARWCRKHRTFTRAAAATLIAASLVAMIAAVLVNQARRAEVAAKDEAILRLGQAVQTVDEMLTGVNLVLRDQPASQPLRRRLLQLAVERYESFVSLHADDPLLRIEHGRTYLRIGDVCRGLDDLDGALDAYQKAGRILTAPTLPPSEYPELVADLAAYHKKLGELWTELGRRDDALEQFRLARQQLQQLPASVPRTLQLAELDINQADAQQRLGDLGLAAQLLAATEATLLASLGTAADDLGLVAELARVRSVWGSVLVRQGQNDRAANVLALAADGYGQLSETHPDNRSYVEGRAFAELNRAQAFALLGEPAKEAEAYQAAVDDFDAVLDSLTDIPYLRENLAIAHCGLGSLENRNCQNRQSVRWVDASLAEFERLVGRTPVPPRRYEGLVHAGSVMGAVLADLGNVDQARQNLDSAIRLLVGTLMPGTDDRCRYYRDTAIASTRLGRVYQQQRRIDEAKSEFEIAIRLLTEALNDDPDEVYARDALAASIECLGDLLGDQHDRRAALEQYRQALEYRNDGCLPALPVFLYRQAALLLKFDDAEKTEAAVEIARRLHVEHPEHGGFRVLLATAWLQAGQDQPAMELLEATDTTQHLEAGPARDFTLALAYCKRDQPGDAELALEAYDRAIEWMNREAPGNLALRRLAGRAAEALGLEPLHPSPPQPLPDDMIDEPLPP
jgi:eukaryotic-like serine/threonine-protein kinase